MTVVQGQSFVDAGANWGDNADGNGFIAGYNSGSVNTNVVGSYTVRYVFIDSSGNMGSIDRVVNVVAVADTTPPVITLVGLSVEEAQETLVAALDEPI